MSAAITATAAAPPSSSIHRRDNNNNIPNSSIRTRVNHCHNCHPILRIHIRKGPQYPSVLHHPLLRIHTLLRPLRIITVRIHIHSSNSSIHSSINISSTHNNNNTNTNSTSITLRARIITAELVLAGMDTRWSSRRPAQIRGLPGAD
jgi:hypothetical protein